MRSQEADGQKVEAWKTPRPGQCVLCVAVVLQVEVGVCVWVCCSRHAAAASRVQGVYPRTLGPTWLQSSAASTASPRHASAFQPSAAAPQEGRGRITVVSRVAWKDQRHPEAVVLERPRAGGRSSGDAPLAPRPPRWRLWAGGAGHTPRGGAPGRWVRGASRPGAACLPVRLRSIRKGVGLGLEKDVRRGAAPSLWPTRALSEATTSARTPGRSHKPCASIISHLFCTFHGGSGGGDGGCVGFEFSRQGSSGSGPVQSPVFVIHMWPRILSNWLPTRGFCLPAVAPIWGSLWVL